MTWLDERVQESIQRGYRVVKEGRTDATGQPVGVTGPPVERDGDLILVDDDNWAHLTRQPED